MRAATAGLTAAVVVGLLFALPSPIGVFGHDIWMPSRLLWEVVPAFRVPSRWTPMVMAALVPLAALGLHALYTRLKAARPGLLPAGAIAAALVVSFLELTVTPAAQRFRTEPVPPEYAAVKETPDGVLAEYPLGASDVYRFWQRRHGRPLLNGAPADTPADYARLVLLDPAQPGTAQALALLGITAVSIHPNAHVDAEVPPREPIGTAGYRLVGRFPDASVWQVIDAPAPALMTLPGGFATPKRDAQLGVVHPFTSGSGVAVIELRARTAGVVGIVFDAVPPAGGARTLRLADSQHEQAFRLDGRTTVGVLVQVPRGVSQLLLKTDPPPTSEADAIVLTTPRAQPASGSPSLRADLVSPDPGF